MKNFINVVPISHYVIREKGLCGEDCKINEILLKLDKII